jgi:hypothetical protein
MASFGIPELPKLPSMQPKRRRPPKPRLDYSIDLETERRKRPRVSLDELNQRGAEVLKERMPELDGQDNRSAITKVMDVLDVPRNFVANLAAGASGMDTGKQERGALQKKVYFSDLLKHWGVAEGPLRSVVGFVGDVAIDPLTYASLGSTAGLSIAKGLPKVVGAAAKGVKAIGKTGRIAEELAPALGKAGRIGQLERGAVAAKGMTAEAKAARTVAATARVKSAKSVVEAATEATAKEAAQKELARAAAALARTTAGRGKVEWRLQQVVKRKIERDALKGKKGALGLFEKYGLKGRGIFRLPFQERAFPTLPFGKQAQQYKAVLGGLASKGQEAAKYATAVKVAGRAAQVAGEKANIEAALRKLGGKFEVTPEAQQRLKIIMEKAGPVPQSKAGRKLTEESAGKFAEYKRFMASKEAPPQVQMANKARLGEEFTENAPGIVNAARGFKRKVFGPGSSPFHQKMVGISETLGPRAASAGKRTLQEFSKEIEPVVQNLVRQGKGKADEIRTTIYHLAEAGPGGRALTGLQQFDPLHGIYQQAAKSGIAADPGVMRIINKHAGLMDSLKQQAVKLGIPEGRIDDYVHRIFTEEAQGQIGMQRGRGALNIQHTAGTLDFPQSAQMGRGHWRIFTNEAGQIEPVLSTSKNLREKLAALKVKGFKETGRKEISTAQWNQWAALPEEKRPALLGPNAPGGKPFQGQLIKTDLAASVGARVQHQVKAEATRTFKMIADKEAVPIPKGVSGASDPRYADFAFVNQRTPDNPFTPMLSQFKEKMFPRQVAQEIDRMTELADNPQAIGQILGLTDKVLGWWKRLALYHPAYAVRNGFQNLFGDVMEGINPFGVVRYTTADSSVARLAQALETGNRTALNFPVAKIGMPADQAYDLATRLNMFGVGRTEAQIALPAGLSREQAAAHMVKAGWSKVRNAVYAANAKLENRMRLASWFQLMDQGASPEEAAMRVIKAMPDLSDLTHIEKTVFARMFPWFSWTRRNGSLQLFHWLPTKPAYAAMLPKFQNLVEGMRGEENVPSELRPEWMREQAAAQVTGDKKGGNAFLMSSWFPFDQLYQLGSLPFSPGKAAQSLISQMRPEARFAVEAGTGMNTFRKTTYPDFSAFDLAKAVPQAIVGRSGTPMDTLLTARPVREVSRMSEMGPGAALGRLAVGGALQPVDYQRGLVDRYHQLNQRQRKLRSDYNRALAAKDQGLASSILKQWVATVKQMHQYKLPLPRKTEQMLSGAGVERTGPP